MLDQAGPGPPCAGPLGPAYVRAWRRYLPQGSAWAGLPAGEEARGKGGRGVPGQGGPVASWGQGCDSNLQHVFI